MKRKRRRLFKNVAIYALIISMLATTVPLQAFASDGDTEITTEATVEASNADDGSDSSSGESCEAVTLEVVDESSGADDASIGNPEEIIVDGEDANTNDDGNTDVTISETPVETPQETASVSSNDPAINEDDNVYTDLEPSQKPFNTFEKSMDFAPMMLMKSAVPNNEPTDPDMAPAIPYDCTITATAVNGTIISCPEGGYKFNMYEVTYKPNDGYEFDKVEIDRVNGYPQSWSDAELATKCSFNTQDTSKITITVYFKEVKSSHNITITANNGTVTKCPETCREGEYFIADYSADYGYTFDYLRVKEGNGEWKTITDSNKNSYGAFMGKEDITIEVYFKVRSDFHTITYEVPEGHGRIEGPKVQGNYDEFNVSIIPDDGYRLSYYLVYENLEDPNCEPVKYTSLSNFIVLHDMKFIAYFEVAPKRIIKEFSVTEIPEPIYFAKSVNEATKILVSDPDLNVSDVTWLNGRTNMYLTDKFEPNKKYTVTFNVNTNDEYEFHYLLKVTSDRYGSQMTYDQKSLHQVSISVTFDTTGLKIPNITYDKGSNYPTALPSDVTVGQEIKLSYVMKNNGNDGLDYQQYDDRGFNITGGNGSDNITPYHTGRRIDANGSEDLTYHLFITQDDIDAGKVSRTFYVKGITNSNIYYTSDKVTINIPIKDGGDIGYIDKVNLTVDDVIIGNTLPTFKLNDSRINMTVNWSPNETVQKDKQYEATITLTLKDTYKGIFDSTCKYTINDKAPYNITKSADSKSVTIQYRVFSEAPSHNFTIDYNLDGCGEVTISQMEYKPGDVVTFNVKINEGYEFKYLHIGPQYIYDYEPTFTYTCKNYDEKVTLSCDRLVKVTYDPGDGQGTSYSNWQKSYVEFKLDDCTFTNPGYEFDYWELQLGTHKRVDGTYTITDDTRDHVFKAIWKPSENPDVPANSTIYFSIGSKSYASGYMDSITVPIGTKYTVPQPEFTPFYGYEFDYWYIKQLDTNVKPGDQIDITLDEMEFTAFWKPFVPTTCYIDFSIGSKNYADGSMDGITVPIGTKYTVPQPEFTPFDGYELDYWYIKQLDTNVKPGDQIDITLEELRFIANWKPSVPTDCTIQFSVGNTLYASGSMFNEKVPTGTKYTVPQPEFTPNDGYEFDYWYIPQLDTNVKPGDQIDITLGEIAFVAFWKEKEPVKHTIYVNCSDGGTFTVKVNNVVANEAMAGDTISWGYTPNEGYMKSNGYPTCTPDVENFKSGIFVMPDHDITIEIKFEVLNVANISFDGNGASGSMEGKTSLIGVNYPLPTCNFIPQDGYEFDYWTINGEKVEGLYHITGDVVYVANWKPIDYNLTTDCSNGSIKFMKDGSVVTKGQIGDTITFEIIPDADYKYVKDSFDFLEGNPTVTFDTDTTGHFTMTAENVKATASFEKNVTPDNSIKNIEVTAVDPVIGANVSDINVRQTGMKGFESEVMIGDDSSKTAYTESTFKANDTYMYTIVLEAPSDSKVSDTCTIKYNGEIVSTTTNIDEVMDAFYNFDGTSKVMFAIILDEAVEIFIGFPTLKETEPETCTVSYVVDGVKASFDVKKGDTHTVVDYKDVYTTSLKDSEEFGVWTDSNNKVYAVGKKITVDADITLTSTVKNKPTYEFRVSTDPTNTECIKSGYDSTNSFVAVPDYDKPIDISKKFAGWVCDGVSCNVGDYIILTKNFVYYPVFVENDKFTVTVNPGNGEPSISSQKYKGSLFDIPEYTWTVPSGKKFDHWEITLDGPSMTGLGTIITPTGTDPIKAMPGDQVKVITRFTITAKFVDDTKPDDPTPDDPKPDDPKPDDPKPDDPKPDDPKPNDPKPNDPTPNVKPSVPTPTNIVTGVMQLPQTGGFESSLLIPVGASIVLLLAGFYLFFASKKRKNINS